MAAAATSARVRSARNADAQPAERRQCQRLDGAGPAGALQVVAGEDLLERLSMRLDAGYDAAERAEAQVHQPLRRTADEQQVAVDGFGGTSPSMTRQAGT